MKKNTGVQKWYTNARGDQNMNSGIQASVRRWTGGEAQQIGRHGLKRDSTGKSLSCMR